MIELAPERIAAACSAEVARAGGPGRPERAEVDSRDLNPGSLFFGLRGERADGGEHAAAALGAGAWGVVVDRERASALTGELDERGADAGAGWVLASADPLRSLQDLARAWRRELACPVVGITGSTGKTSVKDICRALLPPRVQVSPENYNTEVGLPLAILSAPPETETLVLEMAMRGVGQISELCRIAEPTVAAITNVGPVHLELLGTLEAIAEAKAEVLEGLGEGGRAVIPVDAEALEPHLHDRLVTITFGPGGDVLVLETRSAGPRSIEARIGTPEGEATFVFPFDEAYNLANASCAVAIGIALGAPPSEMAHRAPQVTFSRLRGERIDLGGGPVLLNDCYNANPVSMRAALDHLAAIDVDGRRLAVLGEMAELGPDAPEYHREIAARARELGIGPIVGVGELAREYSPDRWAPDAASAVGEIEDLLEPGDAVLVKGSRAVGLELLTDQLVARSGAGAGEEG